MSLPHYKLHKCRCQVCRKFHDDLVEYKRKPNQHGWIQQLCDWHLEQKIGKEMFAKYLLWKNSILDAMKKALPPDLPVT